MKAMSKRLAKEVIFFHKNPKKRCISEGGCRYNGATLGLNTKGCLIGRMLPLKVREQLDELAPMSVSRIWETGIEGVPKFIMDEGNSRILDDFQGLHDYSHNWDNNGLSSRGIQRLNSLIHEYSLIREDFEEVLY